MRIETHSIRAYARSKNLTLQEAFRECFAGVEYGRSNYGLLPSEGARVNKDLLVFQDPKKGVIPHYVLKWLEHERIRQLQCIARAGPSEPLWFGN